MKNELIYKKKTIVDFYHKVKLAPTRVMIEEEGSGIHTEVTMVHCNPK